jgi:hypothetical protein
MFTRYGGPLSRACALTIFAGIAANAQAPVFRPQVDIDQTKLLTGCPVATAPGCQYKLKTVLQSGGDFYSTPFLPWDPKTGQGDGYGEGVDGPRAAQRHAFNPSNPDYRYLRLNGLDSQSCYECHNSIGSTHQNYGEALMRSPFSVGGSAGSNSNAFINPFFPERLTLFIRNPPHVFGTGYVQGIGDEMTFQLLLLRKAARAQAKAKPSQPVTVPMVANSVNFGTFTTTYAAGSPAKINANASSCPAASNPASIGGEPGFYDDVTKLSGVPCDLVVRPFQWKGVSSSVRHFARDALDFHFSMQAFEKVAFCDCDRDGKGNRVTKPEVTIGQVSALVSFVTMMRPPVQAPVVGDAALGKQIFQGSAPGLQLYEHMCANCHIPSQRLRSPNVLVEWPTNANDENAPVIDPANPSTYPILESVCPNGVPNNPNACPMESGYAGAASKGSLVTPAVTSNALPVVRRFNQNVAALERARPALVNGSPGEAGWKSVIVALSKPITGGGIVGHDYVIPLQPDPSLLTNLQLPRLKPNPDGTVDVPLFSDLKTHVMGKFLSDVTDCPSSGPPCPPQGTDVANINTVPDQFLTRPLWGVADTGPWLHDGRAQTLKDAILMHGDTASGSGSEAAPVVDAFEKLTPAQQQALVNYLLTLRLPQPVAAPSAQAKASTGASAGQ